ncbi:MAG: helix-turn-helix transcriptional regulator [Bacteroidaceae bacterium]|nr:helix-turn-helix transcriptional regulator [Bacteroidaceae bacterium]
MYPDFIYYIPNIICLVNLFLLGAGGRKEKTGRKVFFLTLFFILTAIDAVLTTYPPGMLNLKVLYIIRQVIFILFIPSVILFTERYRDNGSQGYTRTYKRRITALLILSTALFTARMFFFQNGELSDISRNVGIAVSLLLSLSLLLLTRQLVREASESTLPAPITPDENQEPADVTDETDEKDETEQEEPTESTGESMFPTAEGTACSDEDPLRVKFEALMKDEQIFLRHGLKITDVAAMLKTNRTYISKLVNNTYHMSFSDFINTLRIDYAEQYLIHNRSARQNEIAKTCGFPNASSFNSVFRKITGMTPRAWYKEHRNN